ncbi:MAG: hypothetical protein A2008_05070 [Candidatus Wallbacteria bacterium GWC2_49_35]|uniref:Fis family transcriptional regulator n=1 Tax=Candidatus Wallbacteria bacterium GWC2_49_35 TaxID=1817813 RepID=A0A1F7WL22_9BACT|nr:MAG: hypothetical protein A2008_05070 [Candidatus Wallbacteria bacterium GWC2_49_35]HBC75238.1 hypothetical protein [Candidatus Wallbacteria bacterium]
MAVRSNNYSILVVDDEDIMRNGLCEPLAASGFDVYGVSSAEAALKYLEEKKAHIIITDLRLPGMSGMQLLTRVLEKRPQTAVLVMTAYGSVETAVDAMKKGAFDYITKPFSFDEVQVLIEKMSEKLDLVMENEKLRTELKGKYRLDNIIGKSSKMQQMYELVEKVSSSSATVIIYGESGTGKELTASAIHYSGQRANKPYIKLNCAALPETLLESELFGYEKGAFTGALTKRAGKFESAEGGTIFLDEIGDIVPEIQVKLLRVLQEKEFMRVGGVTPIRVDVRIICATNANLLEKVKSGKFREDLYYRLNVIPIYIPALRERKEDIPLLVSHFIAKFNAENNKKFKKVSDEVLKLFFNYNWPGNIRQLENTIERIIVLNDAETISGDMITADLMAEFNSATAAGGDKTSSWTTVSSRSGGAGKGSAEAFGGADTGVREAAAPPPAAEGDLNALTIAPLAPLEDVEKAHIARALKKLDWNLSKTARALQIDRKTLYLKIEKYKIEKEDY